MKTILSDLDFLDFRDFVGFSGLLDFLEEFDREFSEQDRQLPIVKILGELEMS